MFLQRYGISTKLFFVAFSSSFNQISGGSIVCFLTNSYNEYPKLSKMVQNLIKAAQMYSNPY